MARIFRKYETERNTADNTIRIKCSSDAEIVFFDVTDPCEADDSKENINIENGYLSYTTKETNLPESEWYEFNGVKIIPEQTENMLLPLPDTNNNDFNFSGCDYITQVDFSNCGDKTEFGNITGYFEGCEALKKINGFQKLKFSTEGGKGMDKLFKGCKSLEGFLDLSFNNVRINFTLLDTAFENCEKLEGIRLGRYYGFETCNKMCLNCKSLKFIDLSEIDLSTVRDCGEMFNGCENLQVVDISTLNISNTFPTGTVYDSIGASGTAIQKLTNYKDMFKGCKKLRYIRCNANFKAMVDNDITDPNESKSFCEVIGLKDIKDNIEFHIVW